MGFGDNISIWEGANTPGAENVCYVFTLEFDSISQGSFKYIYQNSMTKYPRFRALGYPISNININTPTSNTNLNGEGSSGRTYGFFAFFWSPDLPVGSSYFQFHLS